MRCTKCSARALSLSGREHYRKIFGPLLSEFPRIPAPDTYRHPDSDASSGAVLEAAIQENDPETISAFIAEPIIGSSAGAMVPREDYYRRTQEICRRHDVLFIADEVLCGMGRTGRWFAFEHFDVVPDILVLGKGLNGGLAPLSAVVAGRQIVRLERKRCPYQYSLPSLASCSFSTGVPKLIVATLGRIDSPSASRPRPSRTVSSSGRMSDMWTVSGVTSSCWRRPSR